MLKPPHVFVRNTGRLLLTVADIATVLTPLLADWNPSHVFNEQWPSHARFHEPSASARQSLWGRSRYGTNGGALTKCLSPAPSRPPFRSVTGDRSSRRY